MLRKIVITLGFAALLHGCNGYSPDEYGRSSVGAANAPSAAQAELSRIADKYVASSTPGNAGYKIGPMDIVDVSVFGVPELTKTAQVSENGAINLPLLGEVPVSGKTVSQVERELQGKLNAKFLKSAHVSVMVKEYNNSRVTIMGAIKSQSVQSLRGPTTLLQVIAQAGGTDRETASTNVVVFQNADGQRTAVRYDLNDINTGKVADPPVQAGDVIVIEDSALKSSWNVVKQALPFTGIASLMVAL